MGHRYWRYLVTATAYPSAPGDVCLIVETEMRGAVGGSDLTGSGTASASSVYAGSAASYAFDNSTATYWASSYAGADDNAWWLRYDFGAGNAPDVAEVSITAGTGGNQAGAPTAFSVQGSDDATNWTTYASFSSLTWSSGETKTFGVPVRRTESEAAGASEASTATVSTPAGAGAESESAAGAEAQAAFQGFASSEAEAAAAADYYAAALGLAAGASDSAGASESSGAAAGFVAGQAEASGALEASAGEVFPSAASEYSAGQIEAAGASDRCAATVSNPRSAVTRPTAPAWWLRHRRPGRLWPS